MNVFEVLPLIVLEVLNEFANNNASSWGYTDLQDKNTVDTKRAYGRDLGCCALKFLQPPQAATRRLRRF